MSGFTDEEIATELKSRTAAPSASRPFHYRLRVPISGKAEHCPMSADDWFGKSSELVHLAAPVSFP
jgi:hypothetical protein